MSVLYGLANNGLNVETVFALRIEDLKRFIGDIVVV